MLNNGCTITTLYIATESLPFIYMDEFREPIKYQGKTSCDKFLMFYADNEARSNALYEERNSVDFCDLDFLETLQKG